MVFPQGLGNETRKADRNEEGEGCHRPKDRSDPPLHLGRWHLVRVGSTEDGLTGSLTVPGSVRPSRRCPAGTVVATTSVNRLAAARPHPAGNVEASDPDIIMRRSTTSERTMTPAMTSKKEVDTNPQLKGRLTCRTHICPMTCSRQTTRIRAWR